MNMKFKRKLIIPMEVKTMYPLTADIGAAVSARVSELQRILSGEEDKLLFIVGPCSADNESSVLEYLHRLARLQEKVREKVFLVPRVYTNKPRSAGEGYKGMLHQPDPEGGPDLFHGIIATRELHIRAVAETGLACADELLYPENYKYFDDVLGYAAVGARSVEDQQHRLTASGIEVPVGMKNPTSGDLSSLLNAIGTAQRPHTFIYRGWEARSAGNPFAHAILRGASDRAGKCVPNYRYEDLAPFCEEYLASGLRNPAVIVDANHANSGKDAEKQPEIVSDVLESRKKNGTVARLVKGFMIESYLEDGAQPAGGGCYGKSITDPCLGWEKTKRLILTAAGAF